MPATELTQIFENFQNKPLDMDNFDRLWVNTDEVRGQRKIINILKRRLESNAIGSMKILFAGHRGCGKSTELVRLEKEIHNDFLILRFSVVRELDFLNLNYIELFITLMEKLFEFVTNESKIKLQKKLLKNITNWTASKEIEEIKDRYMGMDVNAGASSEFSALTLFKFFFSFRASARASSSLKETIKKNVEPKLSELITNCNLLINEIKNQLEKINKKGILLIIEDLDKIDLSTGEDIFYTHSPQLTQLNCHCIYTFPIALLYNIRFNTIKNNYDECYCLPMIKVFTKDTKVFKKGIDEIKNIIKKRMELTLFKDEKIIDRIIKKSGGCLWDIFRMIKDAADQAIDRGQGQIDDEDYKAAYNALKNDYNHTISENKEKGIKVEEYYETLAACAEDKNKKPPETDILLDLRHNLTILNYNGDDWSDVHPVVKDILKERGYLD